jgi:hypothetical protein
MIGKIERVNLRDVWKHEAFDLTTWKKEMSELSGVSFSGVSSFK